MGRSLKPTPPRAFEIAQRQSAHLVSLVDSLLELSRLLSGKLRMARQLADVRTVVSHAIEAVRSDIESRRQVIHIHLPDLPVWCVVDSSRLQQVFVNLLTNAQRYTDDRGEIRVTVSGDRQVEVSVNDNGPGIAPDARERIFQPFAQQAETGHGLGLGLSISRRIVEMHGGTLDVQTGDGGVGSRFVVSLPSAAQNSGEA
jgi:signal transduction histidine kinase